MGDSLSYLDNLLIETAVLPELQDYEPPNKKRIINNSQEKKQ